MKMKIICMLMMIGMPGVVLAGSSAADIEALRSQLKELKKEVNAMKAALAAKSSGLSSGAAAQLTPVVDASSPDYGKAPAQLTNNDVSEIRQQIASSQLKVETLTDAASTGPIAGLSVTGYIDPSYLYNRAAGTSSFVFANHDRSYSYFNSTFGDAYLDIKKTFGVGPMAPSAEISLLPNRGAGGLFMDEHGNSGINILNTAFITVPVTPTTSVVAGMMPSFGGYEVQQSNQMLTLTHNLLYDFSDPGSYIGAGVNYLSADGHWSWKFMLGNEQYRTAGSVVQIGTNALGDAITSSNRMPTFTARVDYTKGTALDIGGSFNIGRQTLYSGLDSNGNPVYGVGGVAHSPYGTYFFAEADATYTLADVQYNAELDYGQQQNAAFNGGQAQWYGLSLLGHRKFNVPVLGRIGVTARYDLLVNTKNGGGGGGIAQNANGMDTADGFGIGASCLANSKANGGLGFECKGAAHQDVALDLLLYPTQQTMVKIEYRHDWATQDVFLHGNGSYSKSNDIIATQFIYTF